MRSSLFAAALFVAASPGILLAEESLPDPEQVILTASRISEPENVAIASVTVITRADIDRLQPHSVADLLSGLVGISISSNGDLGKSTSVNIRGTNSDHVLVMIDGVKIGSATLGSPAWEQLPVEQIDRIELVRGPLSSLYGSEAIGGVVQIFTRHGVPGQPDTPSLVLSGGSHSTYQAEVGDSGSIRNGWYNASASGLYTNGIPVCAADAPDTAPCFTSTPRQGYWSGSGALSGGYRWDNATANATFLRVEGDTRFDGNIYSGDESRVAQQALGGSLSVTPVSFLDMMFSAGQSEDRSQQYLQGATDGFINTRRDTASWLNEFSAPENQKFVLGADFQQDTVASDAGYVDQSRHDSGVFGLYRWLPEHEELQLSLRHDQDSQFGGHYTGSAQWAYRCTDSFRFTISYGTAFKAPTFNDLYYPFYGDPNLRPETSRSVEVGFDGHSSVLQWALNAYETHINDLIEYNPETFGASNIDEARIRGVEGQLAAGLMGWRILLQATVMDPRDIGVDYGELLPRIPQYTGRLDVDRDIGNFRIGSTLFESGPRYDDPANTERLGGYGTLDLRAGWRFLPRWQAQILVKNALNKDYETALYYNQPKFEAFLTLRYVPTRS